MLPTKSRRTLREVEVKVSQRVGILTCRCHIEALKEARIQAIRVLVEREVLVLELLLLLLLLWLMGTRIGLVLLALLMGHVIGLSIEVLARLGLTDHLIVSVRALDARALLDIDHGSLRHILVLRLHLT